ncbi:sensor histidine kinase [Brumimicrobium aurantiacum]|uniref:histidine kinase n=1 Tax=Brumimicrobium aurantiacum TaxID=1737063 RepID=A0A3E1F2B1_9FLAO|nr:HAMP domain-containing sensor histidine kinase [Brumimicrobium aurantiacum]RFC55847.1 sensor histidine kinase [Brumimicrobium aurantiacum]
MKLLNRSLIYLTGVFFLIIGIWSIIFYFNLKDEIRDSIDDGIDNNRILLLMKVYDDPSLLEHHDFGGNNFRIRPIEKGDALEFRDIYKDTMMYRINESDLEPVRLLHSAFEHKQKYYRITVISSLVEEDDLIEDSFWSVVTLFVILIVSIAIVNNYVLKKVWNPFYNLLNQLETYRLDSNEDELKINSTVSEFVQLEHAANTLISHSREAYISQKEFTGNASHELQTPIAIIIGRLELLLESKKLQDEDAETIAQVIDIAGRMKRLNQSLLLLSKIENKQFLDTETVSINEITENYIANYEELLAFKKIKISVDQSTELKVKMNAALGEALISNLIKNAIFHNFEGGSIRILFTDEMFIIRNTSHQAELNSKNIFNRFVKDQSNQNNTGLGLSISQAVCDSYGLKIDYDFYESYHTFKVDFKNILAEE